MFESEARGAGGLGFGAGDRARKLEVEPRRLQRRDALALAPKLRPVGNALELGADPYRAEQSDLERSAGPRAGSEGPRHVAAEREAGNAGVARLDPHRYRAATGSAA